MPNVQHILSGFIKGRFMKPNWTDFCFQIFRWKGFRIFIRNSELPGFVLFSPPPPPSFGYITCRIDPRVWFQYMTGIHCSNTTQNTRIIHDVWRLLILSNEEKRMIMKKGGVVEKRGGGGNEIHALCACVQTGKVGKNLHRLGEKTFVIK